MGEHITDERLEQIRAAACGRKVATRTVVIGRHEACVLGDGAAAIIRELVREIKVCHGVIQLQSRSIGISTAAEMKAAWKAGNAPAQKYRRHLREKNSDSP